MEGYGWHNGQLARDRGRAVKGYLVWKYPHLNQYRIYIHPQGEDWAGLLRRLSDMPDLPSRDQIANLFDTGLSEEELKNRFRILIDSQSYRYLQSTLFPSLRRAIVRIYWKDSVPDVLTAGNPIGRLLRRHRGRSRKRGHLHSGGKASVTRVRNPADDTPATGAPSCSGIAPGKRLPPRPLRPEPPAPPQRLLHRPLRTAPTHFASLSPVGQNDPRQRQDSPPARWAIKTNLLYWAALAPNLEAELGLGHRWLVGLEALCAWWSNERAHRYYQLFAAGPEVRFRFAGPGRFHGHYVGLYGSAGFYDLENRKTGYQGDFWSAGITYGYQFPVGRSFGVEFAVGAGMIGSSYKTYEPRDGLYVYQQTKRIRYTGLTKARISLLWRFGGKRGTVMNIRRPHILRAAAVTAACLAALCCNACRKTLTYDYRGIPVRVSFDWEGVGAKPEGMRVIFYPLDREGTPYVDNIAPDGGTVELPSGRYAVVMFNNDSETILGFDGEKSFGTIRAYHGAR